MIVRNFILISVALGVSLATALFTREWLVSERAVIAAQVESEAPRQALGVGKVLVATRDMPAGTFLKPESMEWLPWPEDGVVDAYIQEGELALGAFDGTVTRADIRAGQPFMESLVVHPGERGFLAAVLEPGARAVSVPVNATTGISGFIFPGDRVDVLLTMRLDPQGEGQMETRYLSETVLKSIRVLAIDQASQNAEGKAEVAKTATLEVTPGQAETVAVILQMGELSLSLNSLGDSGVDMVATPDPEQTGGNLAVGADGKVIAGRPADEDHTYTLDFDVLEARKDPRLHLGSTDRSGEKKVSGSSSIVVMRADQTENVAY